MKRGIAVLATVSLAACATPIITRPATSPTIQPPVALNASFDKTWNASISWFAEHNVVLKTIDKGSGLIVAEVDSTGLANAAPPKVVANYQSYLRYADCGTRDGVLYNPTAATYNIHVLQDGDQSHFQANAKFEQDGSGVGNKYYVCVSTGRWESDIRTFVKTRAEKR